MQEPSGKGLGLFIGGLLTLAVCVLLTFMSCTSIDTGYVGVPKMFGRVQGYTVDAGLHFLNPIVTVPTVEIRTLNYTMSHVGSEGIKSGDDSVDVISHDGLAVKMDITVLYNIDPAMAPEIIRTIGPDISDHIVRPQIRSSIRDNAAAWTAVELYSDKKDVFVANIQKELDIHLKQYGVHTQQVLLRNIILPDQVMAAITMKMQAQQSSQAMEYKLAQSKQEADQKRIIAQGEADYNRIMTSQLTPEILEARRIDAFKELAHSGNMVPSDVMMSLVKHGK